MTHVEVEDGLQVRFPGRSESFVEGVEIGLLLAELASGQADILRRMRPASIEQAREVAAGFGYRLSVTETIDGWSEIHCTNRRSRPRLTLVR